MREQFRVRFRPDILEASAAMEREAVGSDYGNNGFSTVAQVDALLPFLAVTEGDLLLDIGSGSGWPGLHLAQQSGCRVVVSDLTVEGMRQATHRATQDGMAARTAAVVASARHLPFRPDSFDAIVHTDVLC
jgi:cyclopropane fatty-acyl-phospholipid synthase-like methyltransferase